MNSRFLNAEPVENSLDLPLSKRVLVDLKTRSLRRRIWFRVLNRIERGLVDLTIRWVDNVRSDAMARVLVPILGKLLLALRHGMDQVVVVGRALALKASDLAVRWGNTEAYSWRFARDFWIGLALAH